MTITSMTITRHHETITFTACGRHFQLVRDGRSYAKVYDLLTSRVAVENAHKAPSLESVVAAAKQWSLTDRKQSF